MAILVCGGAGYIGSHAVHQLIQPRQWTGLLGQGNDRCCREGDRQEDRGRIGARRAGDPAQLIASSDKVRRILGWQPHFTEVEEIIAMAWKWQEKHPAGYGE